MQKAEKVILFLSLAINLILGYKLQSVNVPAESSSIEYIEKIDSLELELSNLQEKRDSIGEIIDTVYIKMEENRKQHDKVRDIIISNSASDDYMFFVEYLRKSKTRLDSINNP